MADEQVDWLTEKANLLGEVFRLRLKLSNVEEDLDDARNLAKAYLELLPEDVQNEEKRLRPWLGES